MKTRRPIRAYGFGALLAGMAAGLVHAQVPIPAQPAPAAPLVLRGVTVIDVRAGRRLPNQQVEIVGNRIHTIGPADSARVPPGARVVEARGQFLIPGLWDMHTHAYGYTDIDFPLELANGVTGIRDLNSPIPLETLRVMKREIAAGQRLGPRLIVSGPALGNMSIGDDGKFKGQRHVGDSTVAGIRRVVDSLHAAGADQIKTYFLDRRLYFAAVAEARRLGMGIGGHGIYEDGNWDPNHVGIGGLTLSDSGATLLDHGPWLLGDPCGTENPDALNVEQCAEAGRHFRRNGTWVVLTPLPSLAHPGSKVDRLRYAPAELGDISWLSGDSVVVLRWKLWMREAGDRPTPMSTPDWRVYQRQFEKLNSARVIDHWRELLQYLPVVLGTDCSPVVIALYGYTPGFCLHEALMTEVLAGMSPLEALRTATLNPALALGLSDSLGTVEAGKVADLVLLEADPLTDIWNTTKIRAVVTNGRYYDRAALDSLLVEAERAARERP